MSRIAPHPRGPLALAAAVVAALVVAGLVVAGLRPILVRTFALRVQYAAQVAVARPGHEACEGTIRSSRPASDVGIFGAPAAGAPAVRVLVRSARGRTLASGTMGTVGGAVEHLVALTRPIGGGVPVQVCVRANGGTFSLLGGGAVAPKVTTRGVDPGDQFALVLARRSSFLGSLPTAFSRAAIYRPGWVGSWTFWALLGALVATLGLAAVAVGHATRDDEEPAPPR